MFKALHEAWICKDCLFESAGLSLLPEKVWVGCLVHFGLLFLATKSIHSPQEVETGFEILCHQHSQVLEQVAGRKRPVWAAFTLDPFFFFLRKGGPREAAVAILFWDDFHACFGWSKLVAELHAFVYPIIMRGKAFCGSSFLSSAHGIGQVTYVDFHRLYPSNVEC